MTLEQVTTQFLTELGIQDAGQALRYLQQMPGQGVTDDDVAGILPTLFEALRDSSDPDRALQSFARWFDAIGSRYSYLQSLLRHPVALQVFCLVTGSSQYFADLLVRQPEYFEIIANPGVRGGIKSATTFYREASSLLNACQQPVLKCDALRRWKAREMLRIGVRDLSGLSEMSITAREFSNLADTCVQCAYNIALAQLPLAEGSVMPPFAVLGMGKLGGQELNYSSDIDLVFIHGDDLPEEIIQADKRRVEMPTYLRRFAETLIKNLAGETANGHVFRVDMRLRPEGRFGPLTRTLGSYRAYLESWAESWERQALLKARFIAGNRALGEAIMQTLEPFVYRKQVTTSFLEDIRENKRRIEKSCALEGNTETDIKRGFGGIRDIEFTVQLLQLQHGGHLPQIRTPNTLQALERLHQARLLTAQEAQEMAEDYRFLRNLEHRLQLLHGFQTQNLPEPNRDREYFSLARRMGFGDRSSFEADFRRRRLRTQSHLQKCFRKLRFNIA